MENMTDLGLPYCKEFQANHISYMERRGEKSSEKERREEGRKGEERMGREEKRREEENHVLVWFSKPKSQRCSLSPSRHIKEELKNPTGNISQGPDGVHHYLQASCHILWGQT